MQKQLSDTYTRKILKEIRSGSYSNTYKLPSEREIAEYFGISRTIVRDCLSVLEREGFISRKHGIGTIVNHHVLEVKTRLDLEQEFLDMVEAIDKKPGIAYVKVQKISADDTIANKLKIKEGDKVVRISRLVTADGVAAIYCEDYLAEHLIQNKEYSIKELHQPIFGFIKKYCNTDVYMDLSEIRAILAEEALQSILEIPVGSPLMHIEEVGYNFNGQPILYSREYYVEGMFKQMIVRKKI